jgi:hypothetical protein
MTLFEENTQYFTKVLNGILALHGLPPIDLKWYDIKEIGKWGVCTPSFVQQLYSDKYWENISPNIACFNATDKKELIYNIVEELKYILGIEDKDVLVE